MTSVPLPDSLSPETTGLSPRQVGLILFALTLGGFAIGTGEFASMGLMPNMVASLGVTAVSYTHLDVYKRQPCVMAPGCRIRW